MVFDSLFGNLILFFDFIFMKKYFGVLIIVV